MKLDIGCGQHKKPGFVGMDISQYVGADYVHDWEIYPWPFADISVEEINATHVLEHTKDLMKFMNECYRILKPGATMFVACPYYTSVGCWQDPTHTRGISEKTFMYFNKSIRTQWGLDHYPITADFDCRYTHMIEDDWYQNKTPEEIQFGVQHYFNVCKAIHATLTKR